jgi:hypothetical protein
MAWYNRISSNSNSNSNKQMVLLLHTRHFVLTAAA